MNSLPQSQEPYRSPRARPEHLTHAVLRFSDGQQSRGELRVFSLTGGLLCLPKPVNHGTQVKLMFLTTAGAVQGAAEMLDAISWGLQPFRFISLTGSDQRRLRSAVESFLRSKLVADAWLERYRAMSISRQPPPKTIPRLLLAGLGFVAALACIIIGYSAFFK